ncbi:MAG: hypothetical protein L0215_10480, partial [Gemmataceae bacterium]|nr:hypothetical protein [Gemmataceae bacterium]
MGLPSLLEDLVARANESTSWGPGIHGPAGGASQFAIRRLPPEDARLRQSRELRRRLFPKGFEPVDLLHEERIERVPEQELKLAIKDISRFYRLLSRECDKMISALEAGKTANGWEESLWFAIELINVCQERKSKPLAQPQQQNQQFIRFQQADIKEQFEQVARLLKVLTEGAVAVASKILREKRRSAERGQHNWSMKNEDPFR